MRLLSLFLILLSASGAFASLGEKCIKGNFSADGTCVLVDSGASVDEYGRNSCVDLGLALDRTNDVFGAVRVPPSTAPPDEVGFTGHVNDTGTGLVYAKARYLEPETGRFLSEDPFRGDVNDPFSTQGFTYAHANPTRFTDPTGRCVVWNGEGFETAFRDCGKTLVGYGKGLVKPFGKAVVQQTMMAISIADSVVDLGVLDDEIAYSREQTGQMMQVLGAASTSPAQTARALGGAVVDHVSHAAASGDPEAIGELVGEGTTQALAAAEGGTGVLRGLGRKLKDPLGVGRAVDDGLAAAFADDQVVAFSGRGEVANGFGLAVGELPNFTPRGPVSMSAAHSMSRIGRGTRFGRGGRNVKKTIAERGVDVQADLAEIAAGTAKVRPDGIIRTSSGRTFGRHTEQVGRETVFLTGGPGTVQVTQAEFVVLLQMVENGGLVGNALRHLEGLLSAGNPGVTAESGAKLVGLFR